MLSKAARSAWLDCWVPASISELPAAWTSWSMRLATWEKKGLEMSKTTTPRRRER